MKAKVLPCPFCGECGHVRVTPHKNGKNYYTIGCLTRGCFGWIESPLAFPIEQAADLFHSWNTRAKCRKCGGKGKVLIAVADTEIACEWCEGKEIEIK